MIVPISCTPGHLDESVQLSYSDSLNSGYQASFMVEFRATHSTVFLIYFRDNDCVQQACNSGGKMGRITQTEAGLDYLAWTIVAITAPPYFTTLYRHISRNPTSSAGLSDLSLRLVLCTTSNPTDIARGYKLSPLYSSRSRRTS